VDRRNFIKNSGAGTAGVLMAGNLQSLWSQQSMAQSSIASDAKLIWIDAEGKGRNVHACFRREFQIKKIASEVILNIFADSGYQLYVNGTFVQFGPVRYDPRYPLYDRHNISTLLKPGKNVIAIAVNHFESKTYKAIPATGALICWGNTDGVSFSSNPKNWKCSINETYQHYASKISFALNPRDVIKQSNNLKNWTDSEFNDAGWVPAVELTNQKVFGNLSERNIPFMSLNPLPIKNIKNILPLNKDEDWYSFSLALPDYFDDGIHYKNTFIAFKTYIYSPIKQDIIVGTFWGESWLNGIEIPKGVYNLNEDGTRINQIWSLESGWNYYFSKIGPYYDQLDVYLTFPKGKGIKLNAESNDSEFSFYRSSAMQEESFKKSLSKLTLPFSETEDIKDAGGWIKIKHSDKAFNPCRETYIDKLGFQVEAIKLEQLSQHVFKRNIYVDGFSILFDLGQARLFLPRIKALGVEGATIDITYSEHLSYDNLRLLHAFNYMAGDRIYCQQNQIDFTCSHPRGSRYIKLTFREIKNDIRIETFELLNASYPAEWKGSFKCSDNLLNNIWQLCASTQAVNMEDAYVDCPGRERGMYGRDTIIQYFNNLAVFGDQKLMNRCLELYGQSPDATGKFRAVYPNTGNYTIADFALNMSEGYYAYYENTGDTERIKKDWTALQNNIKWFHNLADEREDLLLDAEWNKKKGIDAHYGGFHGDLETVAGHQSITGIHCVFSCTYLISMDCMRKMALALGKKEEASILENRISKLKKSISEKFFDSRKQAFADNLEMNTHSIHANLFAVRAGVTNQVQYEAVQKHVSNVLPHLFVNGYDEKDGVYFSPNFAFYIFDGLYKSGLYSLAEHLMKEGWGWFLMMGYTTTPEYFRKSAFESTCHAWSASPVYYLSKNILGIEFPEAPNMDIVKINIKAGSISFAEGKYPHSKGVIEVKWHKEGEKIVFDKLKAPEGVQINAL